MPIKARRRNKVKLSVRRQTAKERLTLRNGLTPEQQLKALDARLGLGVGAKKERARLARITETPKTEKAPVKKTEKTEKAPKKAKKKTE
jgi:hypothetical protein